MIFHASGLYKQMNELGFNLPARAICNPSGLWNAFGRSFIAFIKLLTDLLSANVNNVGLNDNDNYDIYLLGLHIDIPTNWESYCKHALAGPCLSRLA